MKTVSSDFKNAAKAVVRTLKATVIIDPDETTPITITDSDRLVSFAIESTGALFETEASVATVKLLGTDYGNLIGKKIRIYWEILTSNEVYEQLHYGYFKITEQPQTKDKEFTTIKATSIMGALQGYKYEPDITYPISIANLASAIASKYSLSLSDMSDLPNADYEIQEDLYVNIAEENYRNILAEIAGATATMATVNNVSQTIYFRPYQTTVQEALDYETLKKLTINDHYGPVNSVVLSRTPQEDNIAITDEESVAENGLTEVKLANNEIMDDDRAAFAENLLNAIDGIEWTGFEATTTGHGWYECGDRISITDDNENTIEGIITYHSITIDGGIKEIIKGIIPEATSTNYALAGGISKTVYNTQIKVDKQRQQIESIVEEQTSFENQTAYNFTNITQNVASVVTSVQNSGGNNLIKNSAMYAKDTETGLPINWEFTEGGTLTIMPSADASANGSLSGQIISLVGKTGSQVITVKPDNDDIAEVSKTYYSFSCRIKKSAAGSCSVTLSDGTQEGSRQILLGNGDSANYDEFSLEAILPHSTELTLEVAGSNDADFSITDMILAVGNYRTQWTQANGEFSNSQVQIDIDGITIKNSNLSGSYTKQTTQEIEVYKNNQLAAILNEEKVEAATGSFKREIDMPPLKIVAQNDGWAWVKKEN